MHQELRKTLTTFWLYSKLLHWFDPFPKWKPIYGLRRLIHKSNFTSPHSHLNKSNTNKCWQVRFLRSLLDRNKLMACMYAHRHAQAVAWGCVISPSGSWRTAGMLIKFDCSLCRIYNSLHFSAFNKLRIQRGSPEPLPRICMRTHKVKGLSSHLSVSTSPERHLNVNVNSLQRVLLYSASF